MPWVSHLSGKGDRVNGGSDHAGCDIEMHQQRSIGSFATFQRLQRQHFTQHPFAPQRSMLTNLTKI